MNGDAASLDALLAGLRQAGAAVRSVNVAQDTDALSHPGLRRRAHRRHRGREAVRTAAIEDADPAKVIAAVRAMGLDRLPEHQLPSWSETALGHVHTRLDTMTRQAVIDVGTNSVKFHVGERRPDGTWTTVADRAEVSRLGEGIAETGAIAGRAMERTAAAIADMTAEAARLKVDGVTAVGTMGLRTATNSQAFIDLVKERTGVVIEVISGDEECRLAYLAVRSASGLADGSLVVFDTGGGSSQFTFGDGNARRSAVQPECGGRPLHRAISP